MRLRLTSFCLAALVALASSADAHFLWLVTEPAERPTVVKLYFGEEASPDDPDLLKNVANTDAWLLGGRRSEPKKLDFKQVDDALVAQLPGAGTVVGNLTYGVISRGGQSFLLNYCAKAYASQLPGTWQAVNDKERLPLEILPTLDGSTVVIEVRWQGQPLADSEVVVAGPGLKEEIKGTTDAKGKFQCSLVGEGVYSLRARYVEKKAGEHDGKTYAESRYYTTLAMPYTKLTLSPVANSWPALPRGVTSFGGAIVGDALYVYGGHYGQAHHYSQEGQSGDFLRLNLASSGKWETLPGGPKVTGVAMVPYQGKLYRVGGFTAKNKDSEEESLWSQDGFASFDPKSNAWTSLAPLPKGRSSHDAAVIGSTLYVVGGWQLQGDATTQWHDTALSVDLSQDKLTWKPIAQPPFHRRALALAEHNGKLYCIGGMQEDGGPTTKTAVYDPATDRWSEGPALLGTAMDGFGSSAFACGGKLYVSGMSGAVQQLAAEGSKWEYVGQLKEPRFFHRMLPWKNQDLVIVGGAHMAVGKLDTLERIGVKPVAQTGR